MGRRSEKSRKAKRRGNAPQTPTKQQYSTGENIAYYFMAAVGLALLGLGVVALLAYFKVF